MDNTLLVTLLDYGYTKQGQYHSHLMFGGGSLLRYDTHMGLPKTHL
jgi:hypothetical protein